MSGEDGEWLVRAGDGGRESGEDEAFGRGGGAERIVGVGSVVACGCGGRG